MMGELLRWLWLSLLTLLGYPPVLKPISDERADWVVDRPLGNTEKYWLFTPLQRMYCLTATLQPGARNRLTQQQLVPAVLRVAITPAFYNLVCTLSQPHSESAVRWCAPNNLEVVRQLIERSITVVGDGGAVKDVIERELATDFDVSDTTVALWRLVVLPTTGTLVWTFQHIVGDGIGARDSVQLLLHHLTDDTAVERSEPFVRPPLTGAVESLLPPALTVSAWVVAIKQLLSKQPTPFIGRMADELPRSTMSTRVHIEQLSTAQTTRAREKARSRGVTVHGLVVAASASALRLVFQPATTPCSVLSPINLRPRMSPTYHRSVGNLFTAYKATTLCTAGDDEDDYWQFARHYMTALQHTVLQHYRTQSILSWLAVRLGMAAVLAGDVAKLRNLRNGSVELSNLGVVVSEEGGAVVGCSDLSFTSRAHNDGPLLLVGLVSCNGCLNLSVSYCAPLVSKEEVRRYVTEMVRFMTE